MGMYWRGLHKISRLDVLNTFKLAGTEVTATAAELNALDGIGASKIAKCYEEEVNCSAGGTAQTEALVTLPKGTLLLEVMTWCTQAFNGDTTKTFEVGVSGNTDKYIDPVDCPVTLDGVMCLVGGTNNDQKKAEPLGADTSLIATWTNTTGATTGKMKVRVVYI